MYIEICAMTTELVFGCLQVAVNVWVCVFLYIQDFHMLKRMQNSIQKLGQQLHAFTISRLSIINATELTKSSWARSIKSIDLIPEIYKDFFVTLLSDGRKFPYVILVPSLERFIHRTTEKLICDAGEEICVLERAGNSYEAKCYPFDRVWYIEYRTMLLDSYIKFRGLTREDIPASSTIKFNTINDYLFIPILEKIRLATFDSMSETLNSELEKFDYLVRVNFKFMNFAKRSLIGGEKVFKAILQPEIKESVFAVLGKTYYRTIFPTHMSILTDQELIMIRENESRSGEDKYGATWSYIPLNHIESLTLNEKNEHLLELSIHLPDSERFKYLFLDSLRQEANQLLFRFQQLTTAV
jgi:hypothetical protein